MKYSCAECDHLDKNRKECGKNGSYRYGCNVNGRICFWCLRDSDLNTGGCSDFKQDTVEQLNMFE